MKAMKLPKELQSFLEVAEAAEEETLVFTKKKRPVAAFVSLRNVDRESLALSTSQPFLKLSTQREKKFGQEKRLHWKLWKESSEQQRLTKGWRTRKTRRSS